MRKLTGCLLALMLCATSLTALAEDKDVYVGSTNSADFTEEYVGDYTTVIINETGNEDAVVYINQNSSGLGDVPSFMLKSDTPDGDYTATFGNASGVVKTVNFTKGQFSLSGSVDGSEKTIALDTADKMAVIHSELQGTQPDGVEDGLWEADKYRKSFGLVGSGLSYTRVYMVSGDGKTCYGYFELTLPETFVTGGTILYGLDIYNIPAENLDMNLYLGTAEDISEVGGAEL